ncbi:Nuclear import receptor [Ceratobasidium sp. 428]|nr:Nuclear import receptor [Ceratobasidium sp. 428]
MYIQATGVTSGVQTQVFRCMRSWLKAGECSPTELVQTPLFDFAFEALGSEPLFDAAVDVICDIIHETQEIDDFLPIIEQITARLITLKPKLHEVDEDTEKMRGYTRIFAEAGETYRLLIVNHIETFYPIVEAMLHCSSYHDLDVVPITFQFWYHLGMTACHRRDSISPLISDAYQKLAVVMIDHLRFPTDFDQLAAQERDDFRDFRHVMGDTLKDCCYVLGSSVSFEDSDREVVAAAGQALRFLCKDCNQHLTSYFSQLHSFVQTMSPKISQSDRVEIYEGIAHVIAAMPLQDAGAALKQLSLELLQKIHEAATTPTLSPKAQVDAICDGVELLLSMLQVVGTFGEELPPSCADTCSQSWVVIDTVLSSHGGDPTISESICRLLRAALPFFGSSALPVIPLVVKRAVLNFNETGIASYPWILRKCIEAHGHTGKVSLREDFKDAYELVSARMSDMLQTQSISNIPDVIEDYAFLTMIMLQYTPDLLLLSPALPTTIQALLACLSLVQPDAIYVGVDFASNLLGHEAMDQTNQSPPPNFPLYAAAIRNAVGPHGPQLVSVLLNGLSGSYPEDVTSTTVSVIGDLANTWPNEFPAWLATAVDVLPTSVVHPTVKTTLLTDISK